MKLYHGTSGAFLSDILTNGIKPRGAKGTNNWKHTVNSNPKCVYLTDSYAPYFAFNAVQGDARCAVIEVDTDLLNVDNLFPDEDFLEQASRGSDNIAGDMKQRTLHYRKKQFYYNYYCNNPEGYGLTTWWEASLRYLGTCAHRGVIPASAITRVVHWPHKLNALLSLIWDPTICLMNQHVMGDQYRELTRKLFAGEFDTRDEIDAKRQADPWSAILPVIEQWKLETFR
jgi:hypothetical protein